MPHKKIRRPIDKAVNTLITKVVNTAKKLGSGGKGKKEKVNSGKIPEEKKDSKELKDNVVKWDRKQIPFITIDGGNHNIKFKLRGSNVQVIIHSKPLPIETLIKNEIKEAEDTGNKPAKLKALAILDYYSDDVLPLIDEIEKLEIKRDSQKGDDRKKTTNKIKSKENELRTPLLLLGKKLSELNLNDESGQAVPSNIYKSNDGIGAEANPLTFLPGNTKGSSPSIDIPGWEHAKKLNAVRDEWVRGHLVSERLHGPGSEEWNLVVINKKTNGDMYSQVEAPAIARAKELWKSESKNDKDKVLYYKTTITKHSGNSPVCDFGDEIEVEWGEQKIIPGTPGKFTDKKEYEVKNFNSPKPSENADDISYSINSIGEPTLVNYFGFKRTFARELPKIMASNKNIKSWSSLQRVILRYINRNPSKSNIIKEQLPQLKQMISTKKIVF